MNQFDRDLPTMSPPLKEDFMQSVEYATFDNRNTPRSKPIPIQIPSSLVQNSEEGQTGTEVADKDSGKKSRLSCASNSPTNQNLNTPTDSKDSPLTKT